MVVTDLQGIANTVVSAVYTSPSNPSQPHAAVQCSVASPQQMTCRTVAGADTAHVWRVTVAGQQSSPVAAGLAFCLTFT
jgi:hypothetical protein